PRHSPYFRYDQLRQLDAPEQVVGRFFKPSRRHARTDWKSVLQHPNGKRLMHSALLLFCAALPAAPPGLDNFDFGTGRLTGWQGEGFYLTTGSGHGPGLSFGVCSSDGKRPGRSGLLHRTFVVLPGVGTIHFSAYATPGADGRLDSNRNVFLEA